MQAAFQLPRGADSPPDSRLAQTALIAQVFRATKVKDLSLERKGDATVNFIQACGRTGGRGVVCTLFDAVSSVQILELALQSESAQREVEWLPIPQDTIGQEIRA